MIGPMRQIKCEASNKNQIPAEVVHIKVHRGFQTSHTHIHWIVTKIPIHTFYAKYFTVICWKLVVKLVPNLWL